MYGKGISYEGDVLNVALKQGVVKRSGNTFSFGDTKLGVGQEASRKTLEGDSKLLKEMEKEVLKVIKEKQKEEAAK